MQRLIVDTNVFLSAFQRSEGNPRTVLDDVLNDRAIMVVSPILLAEVQRSLEKPYYTKRSSSEDRSAYLELIARNAEMYELSTVIKAATRDPKDDYLVQLYRDAQADLLVSGDADLTSAVLDDVTVVTPAEYVSFHRPA